MTNAILKAASRHSFVLCKLQKFSIKNIYIYTYIFPVKDYSDASLLWRVYDLESLRVAVAAPNSPPTFLCLCVSGAICPHVLLQSVCGDGGATGVRDRGERYAWTNPPCAPRYCCLFSSTLCWVDGTHSPSLRWYLCIEYSAVTPCL
ncbi:hypothetical protein TcCL_ESM00964 [Trypanosoma cruzi]|nr:hypothetical protein TcCL_ESM00964 [Trypanosoma cruzi]